MRKLFERKSSRINRKFYYGVLKMEEYKNILKTINDKLAENERVIDYYLNESVRQKEIITKLEAENMELREKIDALTL